MPEGPLQFPEDDPCFCNMKDAVCSLTLNDTKEMVPPEDTYYSQKKWQCFFLILTNV